MPTSRASWRTPSSRRSRSTEPSPRCPRRPRWTDLGPIPQQPTGFCYFHASMATHASDPFEGASAHELVAHLVDRFHPRLYLACSFQKEASVLLDILLEVEP